MAQPEWRYIYKTDCSRLREDTTGVYPPELDLYFEVEENEWQRHTILLDKCTYINGVLSDNKFHPEMPAWFANALGEVARSIGSTETELRSLLCSDDARDRALAYESIAGHFGENNFDDYPVTLTEEEVNDQL